MTNISINLGDAFLIDTPPNGQHLYVAIAETGNGKYLFVNVTTKRPNSDTACILQPGAGIPDFIIRESVIAYKFAREIDSLTLATLITSGSPIPKGSFSQNVLLQIQLGGISSKRLKKKYKQALKDFLNIS